MFYLIVQISLQLSDLAVGVRCVPRRFKIGQPKQKLTPYEFTKIIVLGPHIASSSADCKWANLVGSERLVQMAVLSANLA